MQEETECKTPPTGAQDAPEWTYGKWVFALAVTAGISLMLASVLIMVFGVGGGSVLAAVRVWGVTAAILNVFGALCRVGAHYGRSNAKHSKALNWSWKDVDGLGKTISCLSAAYVIVGLFFVG